MTRYATLTTVGLSSLVLLGAASAVAKDVRLRIRSAPPNTSVRASVGASTGVSGTTDAGGSLSLLLSLGSLGKSGPTDVDIFVTDCRGAEGEVHLVGSGGSPPANCGDDSERDGCECRRIGGFWLTDDTSWIGVDWAEGSVDSHEAGGHGFTVGFGGDFVKFGSEDRDSELEVDDTGVDWSVFAEYQINNWIAIGGSFENLSEIGLSGSYVPGGGGSGSGSSSSSSRLVESVGTIDPCSTEFYARALIRLNDLFAFHGMLGFAYWSAELVSNEVLLIDGVLADSFTSTIDESGYSPLLGGGVDITPHDSFGLRLSYKYLRLKKDGLLDRNVHAGRVHLTYSF